VAALRTSSQEMRKSLDLLATTHHKKANELRMYITALRAAGGAEEGEDEDGEGSSEEDTKYFEEDGMDIPRGRGNRQQGDNFWEEGEMIYARSPPKWGDDALLFVYTNCKGEGGGSTSEGREVGRAEGGGPAWHRYAFPSTASSPTSPPSLSPSSSPWRWMTSLLDSMMPTTTTTSPPALRPLMIENTKIEPAADAAVNDEVDEFFLLDDDDCGAVLTHHPEPSSSSSLSLSSFTFIDE
jgi:hypothetical protein